MANMKGLTERREELQRRMEELVALADTETRALTEEETAEFDQCENEIRAIDETLAREERARSIPAVSTGSLTEEQEERAFADYILGTVEGRAINLDMTNNGAIIPTSIANRIIKAVQDRCPIMARATMYHVKGTLRVPVWTNDVAGGKGITVGYQQEFTELTANSGKFTSVDLGGFLAGALTLIGRSVENNATFSVVDFIVNEMAEQIANWIEGQLLLGAGTSACQGAIHTTNVMTAAGQHAVTADELISLQAMVKQAYQGTACWIMNPATFTAIRKLKDGNNRYLLQDDITGEFPYRLLGKPVFLSDNMYSLAGDNAKDGSILYGDMSGLSINMRENISIEVLREKYATQHAIGVVAWFEFDSRITDNARIALLKAAAPSGGGGD